MVSFCNKGQIQGWGQSIKQENYKSNASEPVKTDEFIEFQKIIIGPHPS